MLPRCSLPSHINFKVGITLYEGAIVAKDTEGKVRVIDLNKGEIV